MHKGHSMHTQRYDRTVIIALIPLLVAAAAPAEEPLNLLFFGNSFTINNDVAGKVREIAIADGHASPTIVADLMGGQDIEYHIAEVQNNPQNNVNNAAIGSGSWDYVVMQGYSTEATYLGRSGDVDPPNDFLNAAPVLYDLVRNSAHGAGVKGVYYETWARPDKVPGSFPTLSDMQSEIRTNYEAVVTDVQVAYEASAARLARVGDAFEDQGFPAALYAADNYHAGPVGSLLASMVIYRTIYSEDVSDIPYADVSSWAASIVNETTWVSLAATADAQPIPEPATMTLLAVGAAALRRRRRP